MLPVRLKNGINLKRKRTEEKVELEKKMKPLKLRHIYYYFELNIFFFSIVFVSIQI